MSDDPKSPWASLDLGVGNSLGGLRTSVHKNHTSFQIAVPHNADRLHEPQVQLFAGAHAQLVVRDPGGEIDLRSGRGGEQGQLDEPNIAVRSKDIAHVYKSK